MGVNDRVYRGGVRLKHLCLVNGIERFQRCRSAQFRDNSTFGDRVSYCLFPAPPAPSTVGNAVRMPESPKNSFSVDTHVFRELGELLVGRDSTALLELIKNCYDADATTVIRDDIANPRPVRTKLNPIYQSAGDLRRQIERQAAYMMEITSTDARRRRSRQPLAERFDAAARLVLPAIERRGIELLNDIPKLLKSPPMFPAEATVVFTNLLTNAVKAAGKDQDGVIWAHGKETADGKTLIVVENTGDKVDLSDAERWFRPFESTTTEVDSSLGRGMGLGLTITRDILEQYGATIQFVAPSKRYATAVEIQFSELKENP
jgi:signal transduction histidine kinase